VPKYSLACSAATASVVANIGTSIVPPGPPACTRRSIAAIEKAA